MHPDSPVVNWWTPARVRAILALYPQLCAVLDGLRAVNLEPTATRSSVPTEAGFAGIVQLKADIDRAVAQLQGRDRRVASDKYREEADEVNIAHEQRVSKRHANRLVMRCVEEITKILCRECPKTVLSTCLVVGKNDNTNILGTC